VPTSGTNAPAVSALLLGLNVSAVLLKYDVFPVATFANAG
jgi:hypothetical protein